MGKVPEEALADRRINQPQESLPLVCGRVDQHAAELPYLRLEQRVDGPAGPAGRFGAILEVFGGDCA